MTRRMFDPKFKPGEVVDNYKLISEIGSGGNGRVYQAIRSTSGYPDWQFAIKFLGARDLEEKTEMFMRWKEEVNSLRNLSHRNIVRVYDAGKHNGFPYIVMDRIEGYPLSDYIGTKRLEEPKILNSLKLGKGILEGLAAVHDAGLIHRDIKPSNILVTNGGTPKIIDFGIVKRAGAELTEYGCVIGTLGHMPFEQMQGIVSPKTDIWSAGLIVYCLLTGYRPADGIKRSGIDANDFGEVLEY